MFYFKDFKQCQILRIFNGYTSKSPVKNFRLQSVSQISSSLNDKIQNGHRNLALPSRGVISFWKTKSYYRGYQNCSFKFNLLKINPVYFMHIFRYKF